MVINRLLNLANHWLSKFTPRQRGATSLFLILIIGVVDFQAGADISLSTLYLVPIGIATWYVDWRSGFATSVLSAIVNRGEDFGAGIAIQHPWLTSWNVLLNLGFMLVFVYLLAHLQNRLRNEEQLARTDVLTGICNRRAFMDNLRYILDLAARENWPVTLTYVDVDDFKRVNDQNGHAEGDKVLCAIALKLSHSVRHTDIVGRLGGDEFALILPHTDRHMAEHLVEKLHRLLGKTMAEGEIPVTCTIGCVTLRVPMTAERAVKEADKLMYEAKNRGKRQIAFAELG